MFSFHYDAYEYFFNALAACLIAVPVFFLLPKPLFRRILMIAVSLYLIYFIAPRLAVFYLMFWLAVFVLQKVMGKTRHLKPGGFLLALFIGILLTPMLAWKALGDFFVIHFNLALNQLMHSVSTPLWESDLMFRAILPIGLSFAVFRGIDLLVKIYIQKIQALSLSETLFYGLFFPVQAVGPLIEWEEVSTQDTRATPPQMLTALLTIAQGALKAFMLAAPLTFTSTWMEVPQTVSPAYLWAGMIGFSWYFYLNFSGYSQIAIGTAGLFGFQLKDNFDNPFAARNIQQFWNRWHISLSRWAQRNIFIPCGGYRPKTQWVALLLTMFAIALWHGLGPEKVIFGLCHGLALVIHRLYSNTASSLRPPSHLIKVAGIILTYAFFALTLPLIALDGKGCLALYTALFGWRS